MLWKVWRRHTSTEGGSWLSPSSFRHHWPRHTHLPGQFFAMKTRGLHFLPMGFPTCTGAGRSLLGTAQGTAHGPLTCHSSSAPGVKRRAEQSQGSFSVDLFSVHLPVCFYLCASVFFFFFCQAYTHSHYKEYSRFLCTDYMLLENGNGCPLATVLLFLWGNSSGMTFVTLGRGSKAGMWLCHKPSWPSDRTEDGGGREGNPGGDTGAEAGSKEIQRVPVGGDLKQREQQGQPGGLEWDCIS